MPPAKLSVHKATSNRVQRNYQYTARLQADLMIKMQFLILCRNGEKGDIHYGRGKNHIIYMGVIFLYADKAQRALCV